MSDSPRGLDQLLQILTDSLDGQFNFALRPPATTAEIEAVEAEIGYRLPDDVRELYLLHDGQDYRVPSNPTGLFLGWPLSPLAEALRGWRENTAMWGRPGMDLTRGTVPEGPIRSLGFDLNWFPLSAAAEARDVVAVDLNPADGGVVGQVIWVGALTDSERSVVATSLRRLLEQLADQVERGSLRTRPDPLGRTTWGLGLQAHGLAAVRRRLESTVGYPHWIDDLPAAWREWFLSEAPEFAVAFTELSWFTVPNGMPDLSPLPFAQALSGLDAQSVELGSLHDVPPLPRLSSLKLGRIRTLDGVERFPRLSRIEVTDAAEISLAPLAHSTVRAFVAKGGVKLDIHIADSVQLEELSASPSDLGQLAAIASLPSVQRLRLQLGGMDPNDVGWSDASALRVLTLAGGRVRDLTFQAAIPRLVSLEIANSTLGSLTGLLDRELLTQRFTQIVGLTADIELVEGLRAPAAITGSLAWFLAVPESARLGVWGSVSAEIPEEEDEARRVDEQLRTVRRRIHAERVERLGVRGAMHFDR